MLLISAQEFSARLTQLFSIFNIKVPGNFSQRVNQSLIFLVANNFDRKFFFADGLENGEGHRAASQEKTVADAT